MANVLGYVACFLPGGEGSSVFLPVADARGRMRRAGIPYVFSLPWGQIMVGPRFSQHVVIPGFRRTQVKSVADEAGSMALLV